MWEATSNVCEKLFCTSCYTINTHFIIYFKDVYSIQAKRVECSFNPKAIKNGKCSLKLIRNSSNLMNFAGDFLYPQTKVAVIFHNIILFFKTIFNLFIFFTIS